MSQTYFVTSALPYVNNVPHLGNIIGSTLSADVCARYLRKFGKAVMFLCGTDEYGTTTEVKAILEKKTCEEICSEYRQIHKKIYDWMNISFDIFGKTTTETQTELSQQIFTELLAKDLMVEKITEQYYCNKCERYVCDRYINGICYFPQCNGETKGDQCDKCCNLVTIDKLSKKWCSICKNVPEKKSSKHLFLKLSTFSEQLKKYFIDKEQLNTKQLQFISQTALSITKAWLSNPLEDRCMTRDLTWGTPFPKIAGYEEYWGKVFYVWFDAPIGYISILKQHCPEWKKWISGNWIQFMAKDNVPFHSVIFPATLLGSSLNVDCGVTHLVATDYLTYNGKKFSKSNNYGIFGDMAIEMSEKAGIDSDYWRYYLIRMFPENGDTDFKLDEFATIIKGELAQKIGNLLNRCLTLLAKTSPDKKTINFDFTDFGDGHQIISEIFSNCIRSYESFKYRDVIKFINELAQFGNEWFNVQKMWNNWTTEHLFGNTFFIIYLYSELCEPIMPKKSQKIKSYVNYSYDNLTYNDIKNVIDQKKGQLNVKCTDIEYLFIQPKFA